MYWDGGWAWMMTLMPLVWITLVGLTVWAVVSLTQGAGGREPRRYRRQLRRETPEEILDRRFASGEIDADAYAAAREQLAAHGPGSR